MFWQSIATSTNPADFEAYLEEFPDGVFRRLAGNRLEALQDTADAPAPPPVPVGGVGSTAPNWEELEVESPYDVCVYIDVVPEVLEVLEVVNGPPVAKACYAKARCVGFSAGIPDINATVICLLTPEGGCPPAFQCYLDPRVQFSKPSMCRICRHSTPIPVVS